MKRTLMAFSAGAALAVGLAGTASAQPRHFAPNHPPIADELARIDQRIDQGARRGVLTRREASLLRRDLNGLARLQDRYRDDGFINRWEDEDLHRRAQSLLQRVRYERRDPEQRGGYGGRRY